MFDQKLQNPKYSEVVGRALPNEVIHLFIFLLIDCKQINVGKDFFSAVKLFSFVGKYLSHIFHNKN